MSAFDNNLMLRTTGNLTVSETSGALTIRGTPVRGMAARVSVPTAFADGDTIQAKVKTSDDDSTYTVIAQSEVLSSFNTNPRDIIVPFTSVRKYVKTELVVTSTTAANINFGAVKSGIVLNTGFAFDRTAGFS